MLRQYELVERVKAYDPDADEDLLNRAYVFSVKAHGQQLRASGDPYFSHPIEVAGILTELKLDDETIATAILHDTIEDTVATPEDLGRLFGPNILRLVDGVTKLSRIEAQTDTERAAENLRKFLVAMSGDIRVLLVKLADRLHNMRTLHHIRSAEKRRRIARETLDIYAPLAGRIGMYEFMEEMEELAFREVEPEAWQTIQRRLAALRARGAGRGRNQRARAGAREAALFDLAQDAAPAHGLRAALRRHRLPRHHPQRRGLLCRARRHPPALADGAGPVQGLHLDPAQEWLSLAAHHGGPARHAAC
jgi:(p)ppGpp synthase/HD superfamily hydrolase